MLQIEAGSVVGAGTGGRTAVEAAGGRASRCVFRFEMCKGSERGDLCTGTACQPGKNVHVVTAFLKNHGTGGGIVCPVAADKTVSLVPVAHVLYLLHRQNLSETSAVYDSLDLAVKRSVAEYVADA